MAGLGSGFEMGIGPGVGVGVWLGVGEFWAVWVGLGGGSVLPRLSGWVDFCNRSVIMHTSTSEPEVLGR